MTKQTINVGITANDKQGDSLRAAFQKVNANFTELYTALGLDVDPLNLGAFEFSGSTLSTTDSSPITIDQATTVTSNLTVGGDILPQTALGGNLGSAAKPWHSLYVSNSTIYLGGTPLSVNGSGQLTVNGTLVSSTDKLAVGAKEVVLTGGTNPFVTFPTVASGENITIQGAEIASANGAVAITSSDSVVINTNALTALNTWTFGDDGNLELPPGFINSNQVTGLNLRSGYDVHIISNHMNVDHEWILDSYGDLTLPGGIKSEGAINIDINLSDSTLRRWTFGEDGDLRLPGALTTNGYIKAVGPTDGDGNGDNLTIQAGETTTGDGGDLTVHAGDTVTGVGGDLTVRSGVAVTGNAGVLNVRASDTVTGDGGMLNIRAGDAVTGDAGDIDIRAGDTITGDGGSITITAGSTVNSGPGGSVTITSGSNTSGAAGDINLVAATSVASTDGVINLTTAIGSWTFGATGNLTFPDASVQTTAWTGTLTVNDSGLTINGGTGTIYQGPSGVLQVGDKKGGVYHAASTSSNGLFTFGMNGGGIMSAAVEGSLFVGNNLPSNNGGVTTAYGGWLVVENGGKFGTDVDTLGNVILGKGVFEKFQAKQDATGTVEHDCINGHIFYHTSPDANWTANFTNLNIATSYSTSVSIVIVQGGTGYYPNAVQIGGVGQTINWQGNATPTPSTNRTDVVTFSILNNSGTYVVLGQLTGF